MALAIHSGGLLPCVVLGRPAYGEAWRPPGRGEAFVEPVGLRSLATGRCVGDASLELASPHLTLAPGDGMAVIPLMGLMAHDFLTRRVDSPFVLPVPLWAYPLYDPGLGLWGSSLPGSRLRVCGCRLRVAESVRGFPSLCLLFAAALRLSLSAGCPCGWRRQAPQSCRFRLHP